MEGTIGEEMMSFFLVFVFHPSSSLTLTHSNLWELLLHPPKRTYTIFLSSLRFLTLPVMVWQRKTNWHVELFSRSFAICLLLKLPTCSPLCVFDISGQAACCYNTLLLKIPLLGNPVSTGFMNWLFVLQQYPVVWREHFSLFIHTFDFYCMFRCFFIDSYSAVL